MQSYILVSKIISAKVLNLNKYIAASSNYSRKDAEKLIKEGWVSVNNSVSKNPMYEVKNDDKVVVKGKLLTYRPDYDYVLVNKALNTKLVKESNPTTRFSVQDIILKKTGKLLSPLEVLPSQFLGLTLFTDDLDLAQKVKSGNHKIKRVFSIEGEFDKSIFENLETKDTLDKKASIRILKMGLSHNEHHQNQIGLEVEGGNCMQIFDLITMLGVKISKFDCTFFGGLTKKDLKRDWVRAISKEEIVFIKYF